MTPLELKTLDLTAKKVAGQLVQKLKANGDWDKLPTRFMIAGGALANGIYNELRGTSLPIRDIDVFTPVDRSKPRPNGAPQPVQYNGEPFNELEQNGVLNLIEVTPETETSEEVYDTSTLKNFDLGCCGVGVSFNRTKKTMQVHTSHQYREFCATGKIQIDPQQYNGGTARKIARYFDKLESYGQLGVCAQSGIHQTLTRLQITAFLSEEPKHIKLVPKTRAKFERALPYLSPYFEVDIDEHNAVKLTPKPTKLINALTPYRGTLSAQEAFLRATKLAAPTKDFLPDTKLEDNKLATICALAQAACTAKWETPTQRETTIAQKLQLLEGITPDQVGAKITELLETGVITVNLAVKQYLLGDMRFAHVALPYFEEPLQPLPRAPNDHEHPLDEWNALHEAAYQELLHKAPIKLLTKEQLTRRYKINGSLLNGSPLEIARHYKGQIMGLPKELTADQEIITDQEIAAYIKYTSTPYRNLAVGTYLIPPNIPTHRLTKELITEAFIPLLQRTESPAQTAELSKLAPQNYAPYYQILREAELPDSVGPWLQEVAKHYLKAQLSASKKCHANRSLHPRGSQ